MKARGIPRWVEFLLALGGILILLPFLLIIGVLVRLTSTGPALFRQERVGREGRNFTMVKFRSMRVQEAGGEITAKGDARITPLGAWLRRLKLDEWPELWNVLKGDMSLVGPRPEVPSWVDLDDERWRKILEVRPGITDPTTLELSDEESLLASVENPEEYYREVLQPKKLAGYLAYLEKRTLGSDFRVIMRTLLRIVPFGTA